MILTIACAAYLKHKVIWLSSVEDELFVLEITGVLHLRLKWDSYRFRQLQEAGDTMANNFPFGDDIETSAVAQLIEYGLVARYKGDPDGLKWARNQIRIEMQAKGWVLSPYTFEAHDFSHAAMHQLSDWPILEQLVREKKSAAKRLDSRAVAAIYGDASQSSWAEMLDKERNFAMAAIELHRP